MDGMEMQQQSKKEQKELRAECLTFPSWDIPMVCVSEVVPLYPAVRVRLTEMALQEVDALCVTGKWIKTRIACVKSINVFRFKIS